MGLATGARDPESRSQVGCLERKASIVERVCGSWQAHVWGLRSPYQPPEWSAGARTRPVPRP